MFLHELTTTDSAVELVRPNVERDASLGVAWLAGPGGRQNLKLMGVADKDNRASSLEEERARIQGFLDNSDQYNWMISYHDQVVGAIWADLKPTPEIPAPAVSIMIGDDAVRGRGIGSAAIQAVVAELHKRGHHTVYPRHLLGNHPSAAMLHKVGFHPDGPAYTDVDGLRWQNCVMTQSEPAGAEVRSEP